MDPYGHYSGMDSTKSSPSLPLYASSSSANVFPGSFSDANQHGHQQHAAQRHSMNLPSSYNFDQAQFTARASSGFGQASGFNSAGRHEDQRYATQNTAHNNHIGASRHSAGPVEDHPSSAVSSHHPFTFARNLDVHSDVPTASTSSSFASLARSASLGGVRKKDPYAAQRDDVERGLAHANTEFESYGEGSASGLAVDAGVYGGGQGFGMGNKQRGSFGQQDSYGMNAYGPSSDGILSDASRNGYGLDPNRGRDRQVGPQSHTTRESISMGAGTGGHNQPSYGGARMSTTQSTATSGMIPPPLNTSGSMDGQANTSYSYGGGSPMSLTMSPYLSATQAPNNDPWPQYRQQQQQVHPPPPQAHRYANDLSPSNIALDPSNSSSPHSSHSGYNAPGAAQAQHQSFSNHYDPAPMIYTPTIPGQNLPYLPSDSLSPRVAAAGLPTQRLQANRSRSSQQLNQQHQRAGLGQDMYAGNGRGSRQGQERDRMSRIGLRKIGSSDPERELRPIIDAGAGGHGRRADPNVTGAFLSPLKCLTSQLTQTYNICNPSFQYEVAHNPRRVLTKPSKPCHNGGSDNEDYDYILYVNDMLTADNGTGDKYLILDVLGQGTFGQVVKCQNMRTHEVVAVKVVKNKPAYFNQSMMEVAILQLLNTEHDKNDEHHLLRMMDHFIHHRHLCLVFECLASNLYELIKHNQFRGLSLQLVKLFTTQLLDALKILKEARLIHCDLKPENILLKSLNSPQIKIIDFGSACHERQTVYTYIQSRFYRSPEVLLGLPYSSAIDMWSLGCIVVELFLGLPLFPGTSEYNQLSRITEMLGQPPSHLLEVGKQVQEFFNVTLEMDGRKKFRLKPMDQYSSEHQTTEQPSKQYFKASKLHDIVRTYPLPKKVVKQSDIDKEMNVRSAFVDFVQGLLNMDPIKRWSPQEAERHPFITGEKFTGPWEPTSITAVPASQSRTAAAPPPDNRAQQKKYGGLVAAPQARGSRAYPDAASYNQQLAQHQQYTAQQQAAAAANRQPFGQSSYSDQSHSGSYGSSSTQYATQEQTRAQTHAHAQSQMRQHQAQPRIPSHTGAMPSSLSATTFPSSRNAVPPLPPTVANPPPTSYYPTTRNRANTINQMDAIPPALARLTHLGPADPAGTRSALTPVLNRDDAIREWERRNLNNAGHLGHSKKASINPGNPQLEYLQEQAELAGQGWGGSQGYGYTIAPPSNAQLEEIGRSNHRQGASGDFGYGDSSTHVQLNSPRLYPANITGAANSNYLPAFPPPAASAFDSFDPRGDASMALMYTPLQPTSAYKVPSSTNRVPQASVSMGARNPFGPNASPAHSPVIPGGPFSPTQQGRRRSTQQNGQYGGYDA